jgi:hypothetical protein
MSEPSKKAKEIAEHACSDFTLNEVESTDAQWDWTEDLAEAIDAHAAEMVAANVKRAVEEERRRWMAILRHHHDPDDKPRPLWKWRLYIRQIALMGESGKWPEGVDRG